MSNEIITVNANKPIIERIYSFDSLSYFHSIHALNVHNVPKSSHLYKEKDYNPKRIGSHLHSSYYFIYL